MNVDQTHTVDCGSDGGAQPEVNGTVNGNGNGPPNSDDGRPSNNTKSTSHDRTGPVSSSAFGDQITSPLLAKKGAAAIICWSGEEGGQSELDSDVSFMSDFESLASGLHSHAGKSTTRNHTASDSTEDVTPDISGVDVDGAIAVVVSP